MAENDVIKTNLASQSGAATVPPTVSSPASVSTGNASLDAFNTNMENRIRTVNNNALQSTITQINSARDRAVRNAEDDREKISPMYQDRMNELDAIYQRQRRNNNMQASVNSINTGAGSQMQLAQSNTAMAGQAGLRRDEAEALLAADKGIRDIKTEYQDQISQAAANGDYKLAADLLDNYGKEYDRTISQAQQLAEFGDFSMYASLYGQGAAQNMEKSWMLQNPDLAWTLGKISRDEYFKMTGKWPRDPSSTGGGGGSSGGAGWYPWWGSAGATNNSNTVTYGSGPSSYETTPDNIDYGAVLNSAHAAMSRDKGANK